MGIIGRLAFLVELRDLMDLKTWKKGKKLHVPILVYFHIIFDLPYLGKPHKTT